MSGIYSDLTKNADAAAKEIMKTILSVSDENSFVETDKFVSENTDLGEAIGEGVVSGFARIADIRVGLFATNSNVLKGSIGKANAKKIIKSINVAVASGLPVIGILDTAGARFAEGIDAMEGYAEIFAALSAAYGTVPTIMAVKGADFGLSSYFCAVTDLCIAYADAQIVTSSPLLLTANTKYDATKIATGMSLAQACDVITNVVKDDKELKSAITSFLRLITEPVAEETDDANRTAAKSVMKKADDILETVFDKNSLFPIRAAYAKEVKTGFARLGAVTVGYVMVDGKITGDGTGKITELLNTCESFDIPVINFVNCDGCVTSVETDGGMIRRVSDMMFTYNSICVPKLSLIYGNAIGLGYTAFASKGMVDYSVAWATAKIGVIGEEAAARLLYKEEIAQAPKKEQATEKLAQVYADENLSAPAVAKKGYLDNVIVPELSRPYLIAALQMFLTKE